MRVAKIMEAQAAKACFSCDRQPGPAEIARMNGSAQGIGEDQVAVFVGRACCQALLQLSVAVLAEPLHRRRRQGHGARASVGLGLAKDEALP